MAHQVKPALNPFYITVCGFRSLATLLLIEPPASVPGKMSVMAEVPEYFCHTPRLHKHSASLAGSEYDKHGTEEGAP